MAQDLIGKCVATVVGTEGNFSDDPQDPGNWTGGRIGVGQLKGTKFGISAAAYPDMDIRNLDVEQAHALYVRDYVNKLRVPLVFPPFALFMIDAAINHGVEGAVVWMQRAIGVKDDGEPGDITKTALQRAMEADPVRTSADVLGERIYDMPSFGAWKHDGRGWSRRCAMLPFQAAQIEKELADG